MRGAAGTDERCVLGDVLKRVAQCELIPPLLRGARARTITNEQYMPAHPGQRRWAPRDTLCGLPSARRR